MNAKLLKAAGFKSIAGARAAALFNNATDAATCCSTQELSGLGDCIYPNFEEYRDNESLYGDETISELRAKYKGHLAKSEQGLARSVLSSVLKSNSVIYYSTNAIVTKALRSWGFKTAGTYDGMEGVVSIMLWTAPKKAKKR
jgi:hypothetical protein